MGIYVLVGSPENKNADPNLERCLVMSKMINIETANKAALEAMAEKMPFCILLVRCLKTGGRFVSVRSVTPKAYETLLVACAKDKNFGAYYSPILSSIRKYGAANHSIAFHSAYRTRKQANAAKKEMVEAQAESHPAQNLNWSRPIKGQTKTEFRWYDEAEVKTMEAKARLRKAKKAATKPVVEVTT